MDAKRFQLKIEGTSPEGTRVRDLADLLKEFQGLIRQMASDLGMVEGEPTLSLVSIEQGSNVLTLSIGRQFATLPTMLADSLQRGSLSPFSIRFVRRLCALGRFSERHAWSLWLIDKLDRSVAPVKLEKPPAIPIARGTTTLHGRVVRVGGKREPKAQIETIQGDTVSVSLSIEQARTLAKHLYEAVALHGNAEWLAQGEPWEWKITHFEVVETLEFATVALDEAIEGLSRAVGGAFDGIDPNDYVRRLRAS